MESARGAPTSALSAEEWSIRLLIAQSLKNPGLTNFVSGVATYALLDSGATYSFIIESFVKQLRILPMDIESRFKVIDPSGERMLTLNGATIDFRRRSVSIRLPSGKAFIFETAQNNQMPHIISRICAKKLIRRGCQCFLASIISVPTTDSRLIEDVEVVKDFQDMFPDDVSGIPPE
ncbi:uncharacterized protein LOC142523865 [Primulina tabacum]|uniref:uncharacterized protein LOC142523865 n=1 Tax=Primulina tabacum TaxID=48773 RepID=UPI003F5A4CEF